MSNHKPRLSLMLRCASASTALAFVLQAASVTSAGDVDAGAATGILIVPGPSSAASYRPPEVPPAPELLALADDGDGDQPEEAKAATALPVIVPQPVHRPGYWEVYSSIPFLRSEYRANPSYRHDATLELLFGKMRPMSINRYYYVPRRYSSYGLTYPYMNRRGENYNFYYPRPTVYRHY